MEVRLPSTDLTVFAFSPDPSWRLPSTGPFALKLIAWLRIAGLPFHLVHEDDTRKGPKGKNPWIVLDGRTVGDTELIIEALSDRTGVDTEAGLSPEQRALGLAIRRTVEEHLHQVFEYEYIVTDAGFSRFEPFVRSLTPPIVGWVLARMLRRHFRKQLAARGVARHSEEEIARMGIADLAALEALLGDRSWFVSDRPTLTDASVFGLVAPFVRSGLSTPVCTHARSRPSLVAFVDRMADLVHGTDHPVDTQRHRAVEAGSQGHLPAQ